MSAAWTGGAFCNDTHALSQGRTGGTPMNYPDREMMPRDTARNQDGIGERELLAVSFGLMWLEKLKD